MYGPISLGIKADNTAWFWGRTFDPAVFGLTINVGYSTPTQIASNWAKFVVLSSSSSDYTPDMYWLTTDGDVWFSSNCYNKNSFKVGIASNWIDIAGSRDGDGSNPYDSLAVIGIKT
jgi:hypothetical protein